VMGRQHHGESERLSFKNFVRWPGFFDFSCQSLIMALPYWGKGSANLIIVNPASAFRLRTPSGLIRTEPQLGSSDSGAACRKR
jgi:hypothetical protein